MTRAVAKEHGISPEVLLRLGRQRSLVKTRAMLVYLGREWSRMSAKELGRQMHRNASVISRLFGRYARNRDLSVEAKLAQILER
ncbi:MAG: helix-turn-helix domain-containing protein [Candidatus Binatia bacterium]